MSALKLLRDRPEVFSGLIAVIDPDTDAAGLIRWFASLRPPALDLLTPDATHDAPPQGRDVDPDRYKRWLIRAFDTWYDEAADMQDGGLGDARARRGRVRDLDSRRGDNAEVVYARPRR